MRQSERMAAAIEELGLGPLEDRLRGVGAYLVGGAARSLAAGDPPEGDIDIAVEADLEPLLAEIETDDGMRRHARFDTATVPLPGGRHADLARTRTETYSEPGALPTVEPASIGEDLARRDFTVNAIAIGLDPPHDVLDPFSGAADLEARTLRVLHPDSFLDDPTRAIRAARYCARLGLEPDGSTLALLARTDLGSVSEDRRRAELARLAAEPVAVLGFRLLSEWSVLPLEDRALDLVEAIDATASEGRGSWASGVREAAIMIAIGGGPDVDRAFALAAVEPASPSEAVALAASASEPVLLAALASGAEWVERYVEEWSRIRLEIDGNDLIGAGLEPGPAIGAALAGALRLKLDGDLPGGAQEELAAALRIAGDSI